MNLISGGCVFLLCLIASKVISEKFQKRADFYNGMMNFNTTLQNEISFKKTTLKSLVEKLDDNNDFNLVIKERFNNNLTKIQIAYLKSEEIVFVKNYLSALGVTDSQTQLNMIKTYGDKILEYEKNAKDLAKKYVYLSAKLGFLSGSIGLIILL